MAIFEYDELPPEQADDMLENQKLMSPSQKLMAQEGRHLMWVNPPKKGGPNGRH